MLISILSQIKKWFENARWSFNHPRGNKTVKSPPKPAQVIVTKQAVKSPPKPAEEASKPAEEAPKPAEEAPKPGEEVIVTEQPNEATFTTPKSRKKKTKADHQASSMDSSNQTTTRRSSRVQAKRS